MKKVLSTPDIADEISLWIRRQVINAGAKGVVIGLSGGLDSAVVAVLSKKALGDGVLGLILPCESPSQDEIDAKLLAEQFNINIEYIDISPIQTAFLNILPEAGRGVVANIKSRLRMITCYYFANKFNYLVAGTGNKSELTIGYFTKYGDGGVDILPIGNLLKGEVRNLAKRLKIPEQIINKAPSAGEWEGQTDEADIGMSYKELDHIIITLEFARFSEGDLNKLEKVARLSLKAKHKLNPIPIFYP